MEQSRLLQGGWALSSSQQETDGAVADRVQAFTKNNVYESRERAGAAPRHGWGMCSREDDAPSTPKISRSDGAAVDLRNMKILENTEPLMY